MSKEDINDKIHQASNQNSFPLSANQCKNNYK